MNETGLPDRNEDDTSPRNTRRVLIGSIIVVILLVLSFAGYVQHLNSQHASEQQIFDNLAVYDTRLDKLDETVRIHTGRLEKLEHDIKNAATQPTENASPSTPASPDTTISSNSSDEARIAVLEKQLAELKASPAPDNAALADSIRLLSVFHHLSDKVLAGKPFASDLSVFEDLVGEDAAFTEPLAALTPYADSGIPTLAELLASFDDSVEALNTTEAIAPAGANFWQRFTFNLKHLVTVRRVDEEQTGQSIDAIVGRAQAHLDREEIEAAIAEIKSLPDNTRSHFSGWLEDAQMQAQAISLIDQIEEHVMQKAFHTGKGASESSPPSDKL